MIADPPLMVGLPEERLRASAMNALAHGADSLYTPLANPVSEMAALRGATLIAKALDTDRAERDPAQLALGSILCAYALDSALFGLHHVVCQTLVRELRIPHAETNATMLPRDARGAEPARRHADDRAGAGAGHQAGRASPSRDRGARRRPAAPLASSAPTATASTRRSKAIIARPELQLTPDVPGAARDPRADRNRLVDGARA